MSALRSLDQRRAASAYAAVVAAEPDRAQRLPAMLQINGLLATWTFFLAKGETALLDSLLSYLRTLPQLQVPAGSAEAVFLHWVGGATGASGSIEGHVLRALTGEALAWSVWLKRAAQARGETVQGGSDA